MDFQDVVAWGPPAWGMGRPRHLPIQGSLESSLGFPHSGASPLGYPHLQPPRAWESWVLTRAHWAGTGADNGHHPPRL